MRMQYVKKLIFARTSVPSNGIFVKLTFYSDFAVHLSG